MSTVQKLNIDRELQRVRTNALELANRRVRAMQQRIREDGAADRAVLGIPDPVAPWRPTSPAEAYGAFLGVFGNAIREMCQAIGRGFNATYRGQNR